MFGRRIAFIGVCVLFLLGPLAPTGGVTPAFAAQSPANPVSPPGGAHYSAVSWTDASGGLWLFGGCRAMEAGDGKTLDSLWKYDRAADTWGLLESGSTADRPGIYGTVGKAVAANNPGAGTQALSWTDGLGVLWCLAGVNYTGATTVGNLNDLWKYDPVTGTWTRMEDVARTGTPGARDYAVSWKSDWGRLWILGGVGLDCADYRTRIIDLWRVHVQAVDTLPPTIQLVGKPELTVECGSAYTDAGATATDNICMGNLTGKIAVTNPVRAAEPGTYTVRYNVTDDEGNSAAERTRSVTVADTEAPAITLSGEAAVTVEYNGEYTDAGAVSLDTCAGELSVEIGGDTVNTAVPGSYTVTYNTRDKCGNSAVETTRTVTVENAEMVADGNGTAPVPDFAAAFRGGGSVPKTTTVTQSPPAGGAVPVGDHTVALTVTDAAGNTTARSAAFTVHKAQSPAVYDAAGAEADLAAVSGTLDVNTSAMTMTLNGAAVAAGADEDGVCVFRFRDVRAAAAVTVNVTGTRPLSITASGDMTWLANLDAAPGTLGGGAGGVGGAPNVPAGAGTAGAAGYGAFGAPGAGGAMGRQGGTALFTAPPDDATLAAGNGGGGGGGSVRGDGGKGADGGGAFILAAQGLLQVTGGRFSAGASGPGGGHSERADSDAGRGGGGTPGMIKLMGSVVLAEGRSVEMLNAPDGYPAHNGRFTRLSNMNAGALAAHAPSFETAGGPAAPVAGENLYGDLLRTNNPLLLAPSPKIPQIAGGPAAIGCLKTDYWNRNDVNALIPDNGQLRYTVLRQPSTGGASVFSGYDQVFVKNSSGTAMDNVAIAGKGIPPQLLPQSSTGTGIAGQLSAGSVWTTVVPAGAVVIVYTKPGIIPAGQTVSAKSTARFAVATASTDIALGYQWRHKGNDLANGPKYSGVDTATLSISDCLSADEGQYTCMVTDPGGGSFEISAPNQSGMLRLSDPAQPALPASAGR